ncbi:MAG: fatty acid biosynthesis transcriptional regulator [Clostridiales bacterium]|nr:fatty acid biosynthesis transcriptional regulator [Clostridiales bacterium]
MNMTKKQRHAYITSIISENPFLKDDELSKQCNVSISTIRNDRAELGIAEYRERVKTAAENEFYTVENKEELLDLKVYETGLSVLETDSSMLFKNTNIVKSQCIYALAENLALNVINAHAALVKVANVKYCEQVHLGDKLVAKSTVKREKDNTYIVHVAITVDMAIVFRGKFNLEIVKDV